MFVYLDQHQTVKEEKCDTIMSMKRRPAWAMSVCVFVYECVCVGADKDTEETKPAVT